MYNGILLIHKKIMKSYHDKMEGTRGYAKRMIYKSYDLSHI